ncbi:MAG: phosphoribosylanthranilate isomerase [Lachnospiraceae bacterium]|nr:phosphoribosylanthranilate isomerase [Lachnospiraceae bacterium]
MTRIKLCGMTREQDIEAANRIRPDLIGFVFAPKSRRYVSPERAAALRRMLDPSIRAVGVFVDESIEAVAKLLSDGVIDLAQLHGHEDDSYVERLRQLTDAPIIQAFQIKGKDDPDTAHASKADHILLDAGAGDGMVLNWSWLKGFDRPYYLAGGLNPDNVEQAIRTLHPYGVDVSSGIETDGVKDAKKMRVFVEQVRSAG